LKWQEKSEYLTGKLTTVGTTKVLLFVMVNNSAAAEHIEKGEHPLQSRSSPSHDCAAYSSSSQLSKTEQGIIVLARKMKDNMKAINFKAVKIYKNGQNLKPIPEQASG